MKTQYQVNNIFKDNGQPLVDIINTYLSNEFDLFQVNNEINDRGICVEE